MRRLVLLTALLGLLVMMGAAQWQRARLAAVLGDAARAGAQVNVNDSADLAQVRAIVVQRAASRGVPIRPEEVTVLPPEMVDVGGTVVYLNRRVRVDHAYRIPAGRLLPSFRLPVGVEVSAPTQLGYLPDGGLQ
jgi:Flp pilus assembly protein TadG